MPWLGNHIFTALTAKELVRYEKLATEGTLRSNIAKFTRSAITETTDAVKSAATRGFTYYRYVLTERELRIQFQEGFIADFMNHFKDLGFDVGRSEEATSSKQSDRKTVIKISWEEK